jgi:hypothetical protein
MTAATVNGLTMSADDYADEIELPSIALASVHH